MQSVKMYTTAVCPYCIQAKKILKLKGVEDIEEIRVDANPQERLKMMELTGQPGRTGRLAGIGLKQFFAIFVVIFLLC